MFCKSCTSVLQAFRECFSGFFNESTIFFRVALPSKAAEDFSTTRDKFIRGWQIFHHSDRNGGIENGVSFYSRNIFLRFGNSYFAEISKNRNTIFPIDFNARQEVIKFTNYINLFAYSLRFPFAEILQRGNIYFDITAFKMEFRLSDLTPVTPHLITWQTPRRSNMIRILSRRWVSGKLDDRKFAINFSDGPWRATYLPKLLHSKMLITLDTRFSSRLLRSTLIFFFLFFFFICKIIKLLIRYISVSFHWRFKKNSWNSYIEITINYEINCREWS